MVSDATRVLSIDVILRNVCEPEMSKRIDFAGKRRKQGRLLSKAVGELKAVIKTAAHQGRIDLQARLDESLARKSVEKGLLAERLQESVVPLFIGDPAGQPDRIGSCVLAQLDSDLFAFTAAHVIRGANSARLFAPPHGGAESCCRCRSAPPT